MLHWLSGEAAFLLTLTVSKRVLALEIGRILSGFPKEYRILGKNVLFEGILFTSIACHSRTSCGFPFQMTRDFIQGVCKVIHAFSRCDYIARVKIVSLDFYHILARLYFLLLLSCFPGCGAYKKENRED